MPVTARLSQQFYDRLGNEVANELVEWFNTVDATYRAELRELDDHNFARIEALLERRFAQVEVRFAKLEALFELQSTAFDARMSGFEARILRWILTSWIGTLGGLAGLVWALAKMVRG